MRFLLILFFSTNHPSYKKNKKFRTKTYSYYAKYQLNSPYCCSAREPQYFHETKPNKTQAQRRIRFSRNTVILFIIYYCYFFFFFTFYYSICSYGRHVILCEIIFHVFRIFFIFYANTVHFEPRKHAVRLKYIKNKSH